MSNTFLLTIDVSLRAGPIPLEIENNVNLKAISLQSNNFNNTIPTVLGSLVELETINFFNTELQGMIPTQLGLLVNLENLFLHFTDLTGSMPEEICNLRRLSLTQLVADCGPRGKVQCQQPECCTICF
jgi:Leucine-rich repeat (LRR) protein